MGLLDGWSTPESDAQGFTPQDRNAKARTPSTPGSMTGMTNTGVPTTNQPAPVKIQAPEGGRTPLGADAWTTWGGGINGAMASMPGPMMQSQASMPGPMMQSQASMPGPMFEQASTQGAPVTNAASELPRSGDTSGDTGGPGAGGDDRDRDLFTSQIKDMLTKVGQATNPADHARAKDELGRSLYQTLSGAGHDVKWEGDTLMVDGRAYSVASGTGGAGTSQGPAGQPSPQDFIKQWQASHPVSEGIGPLADAMKAAGYTNVGRFMYGATASNNELAIDGQKYKVLGGENTPGAYWYEAGTYDGGGGNPNAGAATGAFNDAMNRPVGADTLGGVKAGAGITDPTLSPELANWMPSSSSYTPGDIGFGDIPDFTQQSLLDAMNDPTSMASQSLIQRILNNPESMGQHTTDTMKAAMKDTLAEQQLQEDEDMQRFGAASGISDSNWLASQRLASRRGRDIGIAKAGQDVDIQAAKQNQQDRLNAAGIGMQAQQLRQSAVTSAASAALQKSVITGDRMALRESVKQEAARLKISSDQVMSNFVLEKEKNLLQKYGIDLGAAIDIKKLNQMDIHHREDLMQRMAELEQTLAQNDAQFGARLGHDKDVLNHQVENDNWTHQWLASGGGN